MGIGLRGIPFVVVEAPEPGLHLVAGKQRGQAFAVGRARSEVGERRHQRKVAGDGDELAPERQEVERLPEVLADHAADVRRRGDDAVERAVLGEPLDRRLGAAFGDAGHVVDRVADQGEVIDDALGRDAELGRHAGRVEDFVAHGVDQRHARTDQLGHVLVAGRDDDVEALRGGALRQSADHVVGFDARQGEDRPARSLDAFVDRSDLLGEVVGHRRPVGLVLGVPVVAESLALGVEDADLVGHVLRLVVGIEPT